AVHAGWAFLVFLGRDHALQFHRRGVASRFEVAFRVVHERDTAGHARRKVAAGFAQHHYGAAGHVFAAVVAHAFDDRRGARVTHRETLAGHAVDERFAGDRTVQHRVAGDDVLDGPAAELGVRTHGDA